MQEVPRGMTRKKNKTQKNLPKFTPSRIVKHRYTRADVDIKAHTSLSAGLAGVGSVEEESQ